MIRPPRSFVVACAVLVIAWAWSAPVTRAQAPVLLQAALGEPSLTISAELGTSVALDGEWAAVGVPEDDPHGNFSGAVAIFRRSLVNWAPAGYVDDSAGEVGARLGQSVWLHDDLLAAGAPGAGVSGVAGAGVVILYRRDGADGAWQQLQRVAPSIPEVGGAFGSCLAFVDGRLAVGVPGAGSGDGALELFSLDGSGAHFVSRLVPELSGRSGAFGAALSGSGARLLVGAPLDAAGRALLYQHDGSGFTLLAELAVPGLPINARLGSALAIDGGALALGAPFDSTGGAGEGSVHVFESSGSDWLLVATFRPSSPTLFSGARLGAAVALEADRLAMGAPLDDAAGPLSGGVSLVRRSASGWAVIGAALPGGLGINDEYGAALALEAGTLLVGAPAPFDIPGAAYVFLWGPWVAVGPGVAGAAGVPVLSGVGSLSPGSQARVALADAAAHAPAVLFVGLGALGQPFHGGLLLPSPDLLLPVTTDARGAATLSGRWPASAPPGSVAYCQAWVLDVGGPGGWAASNGLAAIGE